MKKTEPLHWLHLAIQIISLGLMKILQKSKNSTDMAMKCQKLQIFHRSKSGATSSIRVLIPKFPHDLNLMRLHGLGSGLTGFVIPALRMQGAMHQQMRIMRLQCLTLLASFLRQQPNYDESNALLCSAVKPFGALQHERYCQIAMTN